jgi:hemoglobin-like flavoprotein
MTPAEINLVHDTFRQIARISDQAAALFYARLFELDPSLRPMFRGDMTEQGRKLMHVLALAVSSLDRIETLLPAVRQLGVKHTGYGVREEHYATVGEALLWTLEKGLDHLHAPRPDDDRRRPRRAARRRVTPLRHSRDPASRTPTMPSLQLDHSDYPLPQWTPLLAMLIVSAILLFCAATA